MNNKEKFEDAVNRIVGSEHIRYNIGTLSEKTMHSVIKHYLNDNEEFHEIKIGKKFADVYDGNLIYEVQTGAFNTLRDKLSALLCDYTICVVYPIVHTKRIVWIDVETGELSEGRKSNKTGNVYDCFAELYKIKMFLKDPNIRLKLLLVDGIEYRLKSGYANDGKKGYRKFNVVPEKLFDEIDIESLDDYYKLLPEGLPETFDSEIFARCMKRTPYRARTALNVLCHVGVIDKTGKNGRKFLYKSNF